MHRISGKNFRIAASCVLLLLLSGCSTPHRTLYGTDVLRVASIREVLGCEFKGTFTATVYPGARFATDDMEPPVNTGADRDLLIDARNLAHEIMANRILWSSIPFKGSRRFDTFYCREQSTLGSYSDKIKAKCMLPANLERLCTQPGSAQGADFEMICAEQFQPNTYTDTFSTNEKINLIIERQFKGAGALKSGDSGKYCQQYPTR